MYVIYRKSDFTWAEYKKIMNIQNPRFMKYEKMIK